MKAPSIDLPAQSGGSRASLKAERGHVVIVDFWATWCEPCRKSFPRYQALVEKFGGDLAIVGVAEDDEPGGIKAFASDTGAQFPLAWDKDKVAAKKYEPDAMPTSFIIDQNGIVRFVHAGYREGEEKEIEAQVRSLLE